MAGIPVQDELTPMGNYYLIRAKNVDVEGIRLDKVINQVKSSIEAIKTDFYTKEQSDAKYASKSDLATKEDDIKHFKTWSEYEAAKNTIPAGAMFVVDEDNPENQIPKHNLLEGREEKNAHPYTAIEGLQAQLDKKTDVSKTQTLESRMNQFAQLPSGSTAGDAELADIRVGADGKTYENAGEAVRGQVSSLKETIGVLSAFSKTSAVSIQSSGTTQQGTVSTIDGYNRWNFEISGGGYMFKTYAVSNASSYIVMFECTTDPKMSVRIGTNELDSKLYKYDNKYIVVVPRTFISTYGTNLQIRFDNRNGSSALTIANLYINTSIFNEDISALSLEKENCYLSTSGNDSGGDGTQGKPFRTLSKALLENGRKNIYLNATGKAFEGFDVTGINDISIKTTWGAYGPGTAVKAQARIGNIEHISTMTLNNGLLSYNYSASSDKLIYKIFVSKTEDINATTEGQQNAYKVNLIQYTHYGYVRLTPKFSVDECKNTPNSWFYDGSKVYANCENDGMWLLCLGDKQNVCNFTNCSNVYISDVLFVGSEIDLIKFTNCDNVVLDNCTFLCSNTGNGISVYNTNIKLNNCKSILNGNDGFNYHDYGISSMINCEAINNGDDGCSHHQGCDGIIVGGEFYGSGKGGITSPTYGSRVRIENVYCHNNTYGIYSFGKSNGSYRDSKLDLFNSVSLDNGLDLRIECDANIYNTKYATHTFNDNYEINVLD